MVKNLPAMQETHVLSLDHEGNGNLLQKFCLENHGQRSLVGYSPWGHKELDTHTHTLSSKIKQYNGLSSWLDHPVLRLGSLGMLLVSFPSFHTESLASVYSFLLMDGLKGFKLRNSIYIYIFFF